MTTATVERTLSLDEIAEECRQLLDMSDEIVSMCVDEEGLVKSEYHADILKKHESQLRELQECLDALNNAIRETV